MYHTFYESGMVDSVRFFSRRSSMLKSSESDTAEGDTGLIGALERISRCCREVRCQIVARRSTQVTIGTFIGRVYLEGVSAFALACSKRQ